MGLAHLKNYWDVNDSRPTPSWACPASPAGNGAGGDSRVWGADFTFHWQPPTRAKYREVTWRTELLRSERDDEEGVRQEAWGGYSYVESLLAQNLYAGVRYDRVEDPLDPEHVRLGRVPERHLVAERVRPPARRVRLPQGRPDRREGEALHPAAHLGRRTAQA